MALQAYKKAFWIVSVIVLLVACSTHRQVGVEAPISSGADVSVMNKTEAPEDASWLAQVQKDLAAREYFFTRNQKGLQAPNRQHNFRSYLQEDGMVLVRRDDPQDQPLLSMRYAGWTRGDGQQHSQLIPQTARSLSYHENEGRLVHADGFEEWYINREDGLEHGFDIENRPQGEGPLNVFVDIGYARVTQHGNKIIVQLEGGRKLDYSKLLVVDANETPIPAQMVLVSSGRLKIQVNDANARYPLVIDPLLTSTADAALESNQAEARMGISVAGAGDVNGDGFADVIVGAFLYDNGENNEGAAFVYHGSASGLATTATTQLESNQVNASLGNSVAGAGDVNGDGYDDVIVGAWVYDNGESDEGAAFVYHGSASGITSTATTQMESNQVGANLGLSVAGAGDVNGDGYADVIVGAWIYDNGESDEGAAFVYHGSAAGIIATAVTQLESNQANAEMGLSVAGAGDVNGDGYADVIVGSQLYDNGEIDEGVAFVYHGSASGIPTTVTTLLESNQAGALLGNSVAGAGDVNGDGYADVIVGAMSYDNGEADEGVAFVYHGSASGLATTATTLLEANQANARQGYSVASAGDLNGDGYADVIVGAEFFDNGEADEGVVFVYQGGASGITPTAIAQLEGNQADANLGVSVAGAGDVNGDGYADLVVGADRADNGENDEGIAYIYHGGANGIASTVGAQLESNQAGAYLGRSVAGAGDVNGDGYADVIVGAADYDNGETGEGVVFVYHGSASGIGTAAATLLESNQAGAFLGFSVAGAGDVNGDGYADVIAGADSYDNGELNEGAAFIYHGSASGLAPTAATQLERNQANALLGVSVAGAGDVNGDGYADVIVGANAYDNGETDEGAAFVYHGSASGLATTATTLLESNQFDSRFGFSVAGAGDVNGDGYADVIVGAYRYDNGELDEGAAFVYHGSASGIATTAATALESNQAGALMGIGVAGAGDVNGDGFDDVVVGASDYDNGETDEGVVFVYHGSAGGIGTTAATLLESNQEDAFLGFSVAGAGDVNGDGYADVIAGADAYDNGELNEGAAFIYHGSASGLAPTAATQLERNQAGAQLGVSVAGAGDVNGDGYADVIVGANLYYNGESNEGAAFVYYGNSAGRPKLINQTSPTDIPVTSGVSTQTINAFKIRFTANSPRGRERVKLEIEYCAVGTAFGSPGCTTITTANWTDTGADGTVVLAETISGLVSRMYRWRARILYQPFTVTEPGITPASNPTFGPWFRFNASNNAGDIRAANMGPILSLNTGVTLLEGATAIVANTQLNATDLDDAPSGIFYQLDTVPAQGTLWLDADNSGTLNNAEAALTATQIFTQADIDANRLAYQHNGTDQLSDQFQFDLFDGGGIGSLRLDDQVLTLTMTNVNDAPVIVSAPDPEYALVAGQALSVVSAASDSDAGDVLSYSLTGGPEWLSVNTGTGVLSGTVPNTAIGAAWVVTWGVADGAVQLTRDFTLRISRDDADPLADPVNDATIDPASVDQSISLPNLSVQSLGYHAALPSQDLTGNLAPYTLGITALNAQTGYRPGQHTLYWQAQNSVGDTVIAAQTLQVYPTPQHAAHPILLPEGVSSTIPIHLNGDSPVYPLTVAVVVSGTADAQDHTLRDQTLQLEQGSTLDLPIEIIADDVAESNESIFINLTFSTPSGLVLGALGDTRVIITDDNISPTLNLSAQQGVRLGRVVYSTAEAMTMTAEAVDINSGNAVTLNWNPPAALTVLSQTGDALRLDLNGQTSGFYRVRATVQDNIGASVASEIPIHVVSNTGQLSDSTDSDGDGIADNAETYGDSDLDGLPNHLDSANAADHALPLAWQLWRDRYYLASTATTRLTLGLEALALGQVGAMIEADKMQQLNQLVMTRADLMAAGMSNNLVLTNDNEPVYVSVTLTEFGEPGAQGRLVLPLTAAVGGEFVLHAHNATGGWRPFQQNSTNEIHSMAGQAGICDGPFSLSYEAGISLGSHCLLLMVDDGGLNDQDGQADGRITLLLAVTSLPAGAGLTSGVIGTVTQERNIASSAGANTSGGITLLSLMALLMLLVIRVRK